MRPEVDDQKLLFSVHCPSFFPCHFVSFQAPVCLSPENAQRDQRSYSVKRSRLQWRSSSGGIHTPFSGTMVWCRSFLLFYHFVFIVKVTATSFLTLFYSQRRKGAQTEMLEGDGYVRCYGGNFSQSTAKGEGSLMSSMYVNVPEIGKECYFCDCGLWPYCSLVLSHLSPPPTFPSSRAPCTSRARSARRYTWAERVYC